MGTLQREMVARQNAFVDRWSEQETQRQHIDLYTSLKPFAVPKDGWAADANATGSTQHASGQGSDGEIIVPGEDSKRLAERMNVFSDSSFSELDDGPGPSDGPGQSSAQDGAPAAEDEDAEVRLNVKHDDAPGKVDLNVRNEEL